MYELSPFRYTSLSKGHKSRSTLAQVKICYAIVDFSLVRFCGILRATSQRVLELLFFIMSFKNMLLKLLPNIPGDNGLSNDLLKAIAIYASHGFNKRNFVWLRTIVNEC